jgi:acetyl esterase/lipase
MASEPARPVYQPIHHSVRPLLDHEYVKFHDEYYQYVIPDDQRSWDSSARTAKRPWPSTESALAHISATQDMKLGDYEVRFFTPEGERPIDGWPVFIWFHGGGWAIGGIEDGNDLCTLICATACCVVVTVGYRLAPEHPYPAAIEDAMGALKWVYSTEGARTLNVDNTRIAIGGTSAGGNLAAVLSMKATQLEMPITICFQLLVLPVIENTASVSTVWKRNQHAPWLTPARMEWYRRMYLPNTSDGLNWDASPNLAPVEMLAKSPRTWIAVSGQDLLASEAEIYADQLRKAWKENGGNDPEVAVQVYEGATHSLLSMSSKSSLQFVFHESKLTEACF